MLRHGPPHTRMDPVDALTEIAELLERERSSKYKSKAFRAAADAIRELSAAELDDTASLRRRPGIGERTLSVIVEAREGGVPAYLADLRERRGVVSPGTCAGGCGATCTAIPTGRTAPRRSQTWSRPPVRSDTSISR